MKFLQDTLSFFKSTRSILAVIFGLSIPIMAIMRIITGDQFMILATAVVTSYFGRANSKVELNK